MERELNQINVIPLVDVMLVLHRPHDRHLHFDREFRLDTANCDPRDAPPLTKQ